MERVGNVDLLAIREHQKVNLWCVCCSRRVVGDLLVQLDLLARLWLADRDVKLEVLSSEPSVVVRAELLYHAEEFLRVDLDVFDLIVD